MNLPGDDRPAAPNGARAKRPPPRLQLGWRLVLLLVAVLALNYWAASRVTTTPARIAVPYSPFFLQQVEAGNVASITSKGTSIQGTFVHARRYPAGDTKVKPTTLFSTEVPAFADTQALSTLLQAKGVVVNVKSPTSSTPWWETLFLYFGPTLLFILLLVWLMRRAAGGAGVGGLMSFGRSRARRLEGAETGVTFADVAGIDEAKEELTEIVDFLESPDKYRRLGGRIPRGVLLSGLPGTGKTLLARAVAGEAGVPFFSMSASGFVEMLVGVGASRVRDLFAQAKAAAPAIVFIDELDAIGRSRAAGIPGIGGHDEREQTLNQILTEMDGFDPSTGVIVLAATNRPDVLDPALLRPGRFDRRVSVQPPDMTGRRLILEVHTRHVLLAPDVDLAALAATTPGMVGADLANLANEAALLAARRNHERVAMTDFTDALEKIVLGTERKILLSPAERERTAYHEAGHALVGMLTPVADPVRKVSIIPRGAALGVTFAAPATERFSWDEHYLHAKIATMLGGRVAEEVTFGDSSSGAESDIQQLTELVRHMVGRWGMSPKIGPIAVLPPESETHFFPGASEGSPEQQRLVEDELHRIVEEIHAEVTKLLEQHRDQLTALALALLAHETLDEADAYAAAGIARTQPAAEAR